MILRGKKKALKKERVKKGMKRAVLMNVIILALKMHLTPS